MHVALGIRDLDEGRNEGGGKKIDGTETDRSIQSVEGVLAGNVGGEPTLAAWEEVQVLHDLSFHGHSWLLQWEIGAQQREVPKVYENQQPQPTPHVKSRQPPLKRPGQNYRYADEAFFVAQP